MTTIKKIQIILFASIYLWLFQVQNLYAQFVQDDKAKSQTISFFATNFGKKLLTVLQIILGISAILYCIPVLMRLMKDIASTNEQRGGEEDEMTAKKQLISNAIFKIAVVLAIGFGGVGLITYIQTIV